TRLGNPDVGRMNAEQAAGRDAELRPVLETMWELPYREIAAELTERGIPAPRRGEWNAMTVMRVMKRLGIARGKITSARRRQRTRRRSRPGCRGPDRVVMRGRDRNGTGTSNWRPHDYGRFNEPASRWHVEAYLGDARDEGQHSLSEKLRIEFGTRKRTV